MCGDWSGFTAEKDRNVSTKVGIFEAKKITGKVATIAAHGPLRYLRVTNQIFGEPAPRFSGFVFRLGFW